MSHTSKLHAAIRVGVLGAAIAIFGTYAAAAEPASEAAIQLYIPSQNLNDALQALALASRHRLFYQADIVNGKVNPALKGNYTTEEAVRALLAGSDLEYEISADEVVIVRAKVSKDQARVEKTERIRMAQAGGTENPAGPPKDLDASSDNRMEELEEVMVTGTRIVGVKDQFSPVTVYERAEMEAAGFSGVSDLISSLPQNFGGNADAGGGGAGPGSASVNLRGLGTEATLVLVNGRRLSPSGSFGSAVDIANIPSAAIERVEVLTDGASAVYGADAIAGAVNIILRDHYEGAESPVRVGTIVDGDGDELQVAQTFGQRWSRGRALLTYEYSKTDGLDASDRSYAAAAGNPGQLLPNTSRHGLFASGAVQLTSRLELKADGFFNRRKADLIGLRLESVGTATQDFDVDQYGAVATLGFDVGRGWRAETSASFAANKHHDEIFYIDDDNLEVQDTKTDIASVEATLGGPLFDLGAGPARILIGVQGRKEHFDGFRINYPSLAVYLDTENDRTVTAAFGELYIPLIGEGNSRSGVQRLAVTLAGRFESYNDVGESTNPKFGVLWSPVRDVTLRATYGRSFRAANLEQLTEVINLASIVDYYDDQSPTGESVGLWVVGSKADLSPEKSTNFTAGFDYEPSFIPGLQLRATYFGIDFKGRIAAPALNQDPNTFRFFDFALPLERGVDTAVVQDLINRADFFFNYTEFTGTNHTAEDVEFLLDTRPTNTLTTRVDGLDVTLNHRFTTSLGSWSVSVDASRMFKFEDRFSPVTPVVSLSDTIFNPANLRARSGASWSSGPWSVAAFVNYVDSYKDDERLEPETIHSWTTLDASVRYEASAGLLRGTAFTFSMRNVFDEPPPRIQVSGLAGGVFSRNSLGYDPANADPQGRMVSVQATKSW